jgi:hypothetical protein
METCGLVIEQLRQHGAPLLVGEVAAYVPAGGRTCRLAVDEIGLGAGVLDRLREQRLPVVGFNSSRAPTNPADVERFANRRAAAYWHLRELLEQGRIALPPDKELHDELSATQWKVNSGGRVLIEDKEGLTVRLGRSPDRADAVAMAFETFGIRSGFSVGRFRS